MGKQRAGTRPPQCAALLVHVTAPVWARASTSRFRALLMALCLVLPL